VSAQLARASPSGPIDGGVDAFPIALGRADRPALTDLQAALPQYGERTVAKYAADLVRTGVLDNDGRGYSLPTP
jgi:hypothetical protein